jgi:hypothetical protein
MAVISGYAIAFLAGFLSGIVYAPAWGAVASTGVIVALVWVSARWFRGDDEPDDPRRWWRMTARPAAGYALSGWFVLQAIGTTTSAVLDAAPATWLSGVVAIGIAGAYLNSSVRLVASRRPALSPGC